MSIVIPAILLLALLLMAAIVAIAIGANDNTMASIVGARVLTLNAAVLLCGCLHIIGAQLLGGGVSETLGANIVITPFPLDAILVVAFAMTAWLLVSSVKGYPISATHTIVGSVLGVGLLLQIETATQILRWDTILIILSGWVLSPILSLAIAFILQLAVQNFVLHRVRGLVGMRRVEEIFGLLLLIMVIIIGLSRGGNDVSKAVGLLTMFVDPVDMTIPLLVGGVGMAIGVVILGRRVVRTVGMELTELRPSTSFSSAAASAIVLLIGTLFGIPLAATHILITGVIGAGLANRMPINQAPLKRIALTSFLTVPISALLAVVFFWLYVNLGPLFIPLFVN
jgi:phosphate/sulfate permease